jgi:glycosyltransferase involved in cell wall biosynthesis
LLPLLLRKFGRVRACRTIVAPRGEFFPGALAVRARKKRVFLRLARAAGLYNNICWQASNQLEAEHIRSIAGSNVEIISAPELPPVYAAVKGTASPPKVSGALNAIFLSRISPKKNLDGALDLLRQVKGDVVFDIHGTIEDRRYWETCERKIRTLPPHIQARYLGPVLPNAVFETFARHHLLILPTHGENYGYVVVEALLAGCPVYISDQTPWQVVSSREAGSVVDLNMPSVCVKELQQWIDLGPEGMARRRSAATKLGQELANPTEAIIAARCMFDLDVRR